MGFGKTIQALAVKQIESPYALVLTGTPLENKLEELWSVIQFLDPFKLGPFYRFLHDHQVKDERGKVMGYKELHGIREVGKVGTGRFYTIAYVIKIAYL